jgi:hypothetical protein
MSKLGISFARLRTQDGRHLFTLKRPTDNELACLEFETEITDRSQMHEAILHMGFYPTVRIVKTRQNALESLPVVYHRDRAAALSHLAAAYAVDAQPEQAAATARAALPVARAAGSGRIVGEIKSVGARLASYRRLPAVAALLDDLDHGNS